MKYSQRKLAIRKTIAHSAGSAFLAPRLAGAHAPGFIAVVRSARFSDLSRGRANAMAAAKFDGSSCGESSTSLHFLPLFVTFFCVNLPRLTTCFFFVTFLPWLCELN